MLFCPALWNIAQYYPEVQAVTRLTTQDKSILFPYWFTKESNPQLQSPHYYNSVK